MKQRLEAFRFVERHLRQAVEEHLRQAVEEQARLRSQLVDGHEELDFKRVELQRAEKVYELIANRLMMLRTEQASPAQVTLFQQAYPPVEPIARWPYVNMTVAAIVGLFLPLSFTGLWRMRFRRRG